MSSPKVHSSTAVTNRVLAMMFFGEFTLIYPLITIMYSDYGHVSAAGIGVILGLGLALSVILEIPTGIVADKVPRKYVLFCSILLKILALFVLLTMHYFRGYLLATTLFAFSDAFESGTLQAYLYSALGDDNKKIFGKFWARVNAMIMISYTVAYVFTSIVGVHYLLLIVLSIIPCAVALLICLTLPTDSVQRDANTAKPKVFASAVTHIRKSPDLVKLLIGGVIIVALGEVTIEYLSLYYNQIGVSIRFVPIMMAIGNVIGALSFWSLHKWDNILSKLQLVFLIIASGIFIASFRNNVAIAVVGVTLFTRYIRLLQVQYESNVQHLANNEARATISSIGNFAASLVGALIMGAIGLSASHNSIVQPIRVSLLVGALFYFIIQIFNRRQKNTPPEPGLPRYDIIDGEKLLQ